MGHRVEPYEQDVSVAIQVIRNQHVSGSSPLVGST